MYLCEFFCTVIASIKMTNEFDNIQFSPIRNYHYEQWFREVHYNGRELEEDEKREFLQVGVFTISPL